jgi:hypothetical protein
VFFKFGGLSTYRSIRIGFPSGSISTRLAGPVLDSSGSDRVGISPAGDRVSRSPTFKRLFWQDAKTGGRDAYPTREHHCSCLCTFPSFTMKATSLSRVTSGSRSPYGDEVGACAGVHAPGTQTCSLCGQRSCTPLQKRQRIRYPLAAQATCLCSRRVKIARD